MELLCIVYGSITIALLIAHVDDYMKTWPAKPYAIGRLRLSNPTHVSIASGSPTSLEV